MAVHVGQQDIGDLEGVVLPVALHHYALIGCHTVAGNQPVQLIQRVFLGGARHDQQLAAAAGILVQHLHLLLGQVAIRAVDHDTAGILRHCVHGEQGERIDLDVFFLQLFLEGGGQLRLPVSLQ